MKARPRNEDISEVVNSIRLLQGISRKQSSEFIRKYRITGPQFGAVRIVSLNPGISMRQLSERLYLHISTVSGIADRLEKRGYIRRERSAEDRRKVQLYVTDDGKKVVKNTPLAGMGLFFHTIHELPAKQLKDILKGLRLILGIMKLKNERNIDIG